MAEGNDFIRLLFAQAQQPAMFGGLLRLAFADAGVMLTDDEQQRIQASMQRFAEDRNFNDILKQPETATPKRMRGLLEAALTEAAIPMIDAQQKSIYASMERLETNPRVKKLLNEPEKRADSAELPTGAKPSALTETKKPYDPLAVKAEWGSHRDEWHKNITITDVTSGTRDRGGIAEPVTQYNVIINLSGGPKKGVVNPSEILMSNPPLHEVRYDDGSYDYIGVDDFKKAKGRYDGKPVQVGQSSAMEDAVKKYHDKDHTPKPSAEEVATFTGPANLRTGRDSGIA